MTALRKPKAEENQQPRHVTDNPLDLLHERARSLAARASNGSLPFIDAVDMAYSAADLAGLVQRYGDDVIQMVLADAFGGRP